jgi:hypothetical protein
MRLQALTESTAAIANDRRRAQRGPMLWPSVRARAPYRTHRQVGGSPYFPRRMAKYTGTPAATIAIPGQVVPGR